MQTASLVWNIFCLNFSSLLCFGSDCIKEVLYIESSVFCIFFPLFFLWYCLFPLSLSDLYPFHISERNHIEYKPRRSSARTRTSASTRTTTATEWTSEQEPLQGERQELRWLWRTFSRPRWVCTSPASTSKRHVNRIHAAALILPSRSHIIMLPVSCCHNCAIALTQLLSCRLMMQQHLCHCSHTAALVQPLSRCSIYTAPHKEKHFGRRIHAAALTQQHFRSRIYAAARAPPHSRCSSRAAAL